MPVTRGGPREALERLRRRGRRGSARGHADLAEEVGQPGGGDDERHGRLPGAVAERMPGAAGDVEDGARADAHPTVRVGEALDLAREGDERLGLGVAVQRHGAARRDRASHQARGAVVVGDDQELEGGPEDVEGLDRMRPDEVGDERRAHDRPSLRVQVPISRGHRAACASACAVSRAKDSNHLASRLAS